MTDEPDELQHALNKLEALSELDVDEHAEVFEEIHEAMRRTLDSDSDV